MELEPWLYIAIGAVVVGLSGSINGRNFRGKNNTFAAEYIVMVMAWPLLLMIIILANCYILIRSFFK